LGCTFLQDQATPLQGNEAGEVPGQVIEAWQQLRQAILDEDPWAVARMAHFPLKSLDYGYSDFTDADALVAAYSKVFDPILTKIIREDQIDIAQGDPGYEVDCANGYMIFGFERFGDRYLLSYLGSINE
jgi:hypothetical protein